MAHHFSRQELFDLLWTEPTKAVAKRLGVSDVWLAKTCRRAGLLLPPRGYWAKIKAGHKVTKPRLPRRVPGQSDRITIGQERRRSTAPADEPVFTPVPPEPFFEESLEEIETQVRRRLKRVPQSKDLEDVHAKVAKYLREDELRRATDRG